MSVGTEKGTELHGTGVTGASELPRECWESTWVLWRSASAFFCNSWAIAPALDWALLLFYISFITLAIPHHSLQPITFLLSKLFGFLLCIKLIFLMQFSRFFFSFALYPLIPHLTEGSLVSIVLQSSRLHESMYLFHSPDMEAIQVSFFFQYKFSTFSLIFSPVFGGVFCWTLRVDFCLLS